MASTPLLSALAQAGALEPFQPRLCHQVFGREIEQARAAGVAGAAWQTYWSDRLGPWLDLLLAQLPPAAAEAARGGGRLLVWPFDRAHLFGNLIREPWAVSRAFGRHYSHRVMLTRPRQVAQNPAVYDMAMAGWHQVVSEDPRLLALARVNVGLIHHRGVDFLLCDETYPPYLIHQMLLGDGLTERLAIPPAQAEAAHDILRRLGVPDDARLVTLHVREANPGQAHRNSSINQFLPALETLLANDYWIIRLGRRPMPMLVHPSHRIIDLPYCPLYDPVLDAYAVWRSEFMVVTDSGPSSLGWFFHKPLLILNGTFHYNRSPVRLDFTTYLKYFSPARGRCLSHQELLDISIYHQQTNQQFASLGLEVHPLADEEMVAITEEFLGLGPDMTAAPERPVQQRFKAQALAEHVRLFYDPERFAPGRYIDRWRAWYSTGALPGFRLSETYTERNPWFLA
ncbi:TIGR04372 family glycosyltransferase [Roseospirillum parvum]|uniref:Putative glycosyltransferase, TIGR04372 family n=1 Tax=Roseospirillum parvum TaxID=83401 RepID=A0A1G7TUS8_9PROT|nr:TIGR04372 family glycosyltransferase [Roseospirillum parvum]SDG39077.1 putative glycosyltransferase, TIGR04372 family [Roseospirillum parvum]